MYRCIKVGRFLPLSVVLQYTPYRYIHVQQKTTHKQRDLEQTKDRYLQLLALT